MDLSRPAIKMCRLYNIHNVQDYTEWITFRDDIFNVTEFFVNDPIANKSAPVYHDSVDININEYPLPLNMCVPNHFIHYIALWMARL